MKRLILTFRRPAAAVIAVMGLMTVAPAVSRGGVVFYTNQTAFNAAEPGLPVQSFNSADLFGQTFVTQPNGLNDTTSNAVRHHQELRQEILHYYTRESHLLKDCAQFPLGRRAKLDSTCIGTRIREA
jgi:hypothetical protein